MRIRVSILLLVALSLNFTHQIVGQTPAQQAQDETPIRLRANEVSVDLVVRDKKGKLIKDLSAADIEIYEDGVRQKVESFRFVAREVVEPTTTKPKEGP